MERKYKVGEKVDINRDNEIIQAEVFAYVNLDCGNKQSYSLRIGSHFIFVDEEEIIERTNE